MWSVLAWTVRGAWSAPWYLPHIARWSRVQTSWPARAPALATDREQQKEHILTLVSAKATPAQHHAQHCSICGAARHTQACLHARTRMHMCTQIQTQMRMCINTGTHTNTQTHARAHIHTHKHPGTHAHAHTKTLIHTHTRTCICMHVIFTLETRKGKTITTSRGRENWWMQRQFWCGPPWGTTHPPDLHPVPQPRQKGYWSALSKILHSCIHWSRPETQVLQSYGAKTELWNAHAHMTYQAPTTGLHSPLLLRILKNSTGYLLLAQSWVFGVNCCSISLTHHAAWTQARVPLTSGHVQRPPLLPNLLKKNANWLGLRILMIS
jgi:hypothetical protein